MSTSLELVAFRGVHNFEAKLLSPFLARYGMDGNGRPKLLSELNANRSAHFNCGALSNKSFVMPESDYKIPGAGQDLMVAQTGYLAETLRFKFKCTNFFSFKKFHSFLQIINIMFENLNI